MRIFCAVFLFLFVAATDMSKAQEAVPDTLSTSVPVGTPAAADTLTGELIPAPPESPAASLVRALAGRRPSSLRAPGGPERGVTWQRPPTFEAAVQDLWEMWHAGVNAVRTSIIRDDRILSFADTIGIRFYFDLPISHLAAERLTDSLNYATALVDTIAAMARSHRSVAAVGLASYSETTDTTACDYFRTLKRRVAAADSANVRFYYLTTFIESDRCAGAVDFVLADIRDRTDPAELLRRWHAAGKESPLGIGALGVWVRADTLSGLNVPSSPERQARYFETHLPLLLTDTLSVSPPVVFVHGWRDSQLETAVTGRDLLDPLMDHYGLHRLTDEPRPALEVVKGIYTGTQSVFAFKGGRRVSEDLRWPTPLGWGVILLLGMFFALSPRFRHMIPRYFRAHFFYREAVREGRDVLFGASAVLLTSLGAAAGVVTAVLLSHVKDTYAFILVLRWLQPTTRDVVATLLSQPLILMVLVASVYALATMLWTVVLSLSSRLKYRISPGQGLMLIVWPRWPLLIIMIAAMVLANDPAPDMRLVLGLAAAWIAISTFAALRTTFDFALVTRVPFYMLIPVLAFHPAVIAAALIYFLLLPAEPELNFLWSVIREG